jgi:hypothetical protein
MSARLVLGGRSSSPGGLATEDLLFSHKLSGGWMGIVINAARLARHVLNS